MAHRVLKERVFAPMGRKLGIFKATDLETFDIEYEESDEDNGPSDGPSGKSSSVPSPKDDNPIKPDSDDNSSSGSGGSSDGNEEDDNDDEPYTGELDPYGQDLDDEEPLDSGDGKKSSGGGGGESGDSTESNDDGNSGDDSDPGNGGDSGSDSEDTDGDGASGDGGDGDSEDDDYGDGEYDDFGKSSGGDSDGDNEDEDNELGGSGDSDDSGDFGDSDSSNDSGDSSGGSSSEGDSGKGNSGNGDNDDNTSTDDSSGEGSEADFDEGDDDWDPKEGSDEWANSDLQKALSELEDGETDLDKERRDAEDNDETTEGLERKREKDSNPRDKSILDRDEQRSIKDALGKAIKDADKAKKEMLEGGSEMEDSILKEMGAGAITTLFNPKTVSDWRRNLERVLDGALGFDIITNPNLINKKIEDAPPGREDELPEIKNVLVMLDCSGSMGYKEFVQVVDHLDTMMRARNMSKTYFHIIDWGTSSVQDVSKTYVKVKGSMFKKEIRTHKDHGWSTNLIPGLLVASQKVHKPEAIIIMTDGEIYDSMGLDRTSAGQIAGQYLKKYRKKIIWALTIDGNVSIVEKFDPTAKAMGRIIKFKKSK